jgi:signal transduction histidine kinase
MGQAGRGRLGIAAALLGLVAFTAAVGAASWAALDRASYLLQRASYSQRQLELFGQVSSRLNRAVADHLRALALGQPAAISDWQRALNADLATLQTVTEAEIALVDHDGDEQAGEEQELTGIAAWNAHVAAMAESARHSVVTAKTDGLEAALRQFEQQGRQPHAEALLVGLSAAAADEHHEIQIVNQQMEQTRNHLVLLGLGAVGAHALVAAVVAGGMIRRREQLESEVARRTQDLRHANAELQRIDECRKRFFADVSHELRTPLTTIQGEAEVMLAVGAVEQEDYRATLTAIQVNADCLRRRIDDLLAVARSGDGQIVFAACPVDVPLLLTAALDEVRGLARVNEVGLNLVSSLPDLTRVVGDQSWLKQALLTVLDNAIKFSRPGQAVTVAAKQHHDTLTVEISDLGEGIAEADLPRLFDRFFQAPSGRQRGGSGLGLAVARWITEGHGGEIAITSGLNAGTTVTLTLPVLHEREMA